MPGSSKRFLPGSRARSLNKQDGSRVHLRLKYHHGRYRAEMKQTGCPRLSNGAI
jgi:hypothetical protein